VVTAQANSHARWSAVVHFYSKTWDGSASRSLSLHPDEEGQGTRWPTAGDVVWVPVLGRSPPGPHPACTGQ
jgi:hypothetical protein